MKKITVALDDEDYVRLIDYVAAKSKRSKARLSVSGSASELIARGLAGLEWKEAPEAS